ncbi:MAG: sigma-54-dependent Fis family transcriptional regulator, partial [Methylococcales bacterium]|nr:sigma-54-dependent Fis family transcriptional regulator [Methylococcales bacterium]
HEVRVLFVGEAGVGKKLYARYLHHHSARRDGAFIEVSVGNIAPENSAVEFFGKEENGVIHQGLLEQAHGGTLFLDKISEMDQATQSRLFNALESNSFLRVGGNHAIHVDINIIASTRVALEDEVSAGRFQQDLYYLLNVVTLDIKPLREHSEDVPSLLTFYVDYFIKMEKLPFRKFSMAAQNFLRNYSWYGNTRELKNLVQRLMILGVGSEIELEEVKNALGSIAETPSLLDSVPEFFNLPLKEAREHFEKSYLEYHFERNSGSVAKLAAAIEMERTHLYRKLHALNIKR